MNWPFIPGQFYSSGDEVVLYNNWGNITINSLTPKCLNYIIKGVTSMVSFSVNEIEDYTKKISNLKEEKNAVILAHNYQRPEIQNIADLVGDSLGLSAEASKIEKDVIVFCGVKFMAESAKILSPDKTVLHPVEDSLCPMANMIDAETVREMRKEYPDGAVVAYVNTTAEVKAEVDVCCTSANAVKTVKALQEKDIIFIPDINLGMYVKRFVQDKNIILYPGYCPTHDQIQVTSVKEIKRYHPEAEILVHPESTPDVIDLADGVFSTEGMARYALASDTKEFIIITEKEMVYRLETLSARKGLNKKFYSIDTAICPNMKKITIDTVAECLNSLEPRIELAEDLIRKARIPLDRMISIGR